MDECRKQFERDAAKIAADMWVEWFQNPAHVDVCVSINDAILKAAEKVEADHVR